MLWIPGQVPTQLVDHHGWRLRGNTQTETPKLLLLVFLESTQDWKDDTCHPEMQHLNNRVAAVANSADVTPVCNWRADSSCKRFLMSTCCSFELQKCKQKVTSSVQRPEWCGAEFWWVVYKESLGIQIWTRSTHQTWGWWMKKLQASHRPGPKAFMDAINTRTACILAASCLHPLGYVSSPGQTRQLIWTCREKMLKWPRVIVNAVRWNLKVSKYWHFILNPGAYGCLPRCSFFKWLFMWHHATM